MEGGDAIRTLDVRQLGREAVICSFLVGDVMVDCGPGSRLATLLEALGDARPRVLALTHIHLDHAGAAGALVERWPDLEVWVHERGAPHMIDPAKLLASATRLYGEDMDRLWGEFLAVPESNVRVLRGGESIDGIEVAYTPGHASHHLSYLHERTGTAFVGDVAGVRAPGGGYVLAPTPPPDIDVETWQESIARVRAWQPRALALTHFGTFTDVSWHLDAIERSLALAAQRARDLSLEEFSSATRADIEADEAGRDAAVYALAAPLDHDYAGLERYWARRGEER
jgi:glyoxylase-like metal-dependent hydrolase (beta-lactamase superfamily II)